MRATCERQSAPQGWRNRHGDPRFVLFHPASGRSGGRCGVVSHHWLSGLRPIASAPLLCRTNVIRSLAPKK